MSSQNLDFCSSYFQLLLWWNWVFRTNMESNAAVTLHFENLAVQNYLFLKDMCICWWKISNCLTKAFLMNVKFFFLNILKTKCNSVRERAFLTLSRTLLCVVFKIFKKEKLCIHQKCFFKQFGIFFINECTHLFKTSNVGPQGPQNAALLSMLVQKNQFQRGNWK